MDLLLLPGLSVLQLNCDALVALPSVAAGAEDCRDQSSCADEPRIRRRSIVCLVVGNDGWSMGQVDMERECTSLEFRRCKIGLKPAMVIAVSKRAPARPRYARTFGPRLPFTPPLAAVFATFVALGASSARSSAGRFLVPEGSCKYSKDVFSHSDCLTCLP